MGNKKSAGLWADGLGLGLGGYALFRVMRLVLHGKESRSGRKGSTPLSTAFLQVEGKGPSIMFLEDLNMVNRTYWIHMNEILLPVQR